MENDLKTRLMILFNGLSVPKIAEKMEVNYSTLTNWITGRTDFPSAELAKIARLSGGSLNYLLTGEGVAFNEISSPSFNEIFDTKIQQSIREEIMRGAVTVKDSFDNDLSYVVLNAKFTKTTSEIFIEIANRIKEAIEVRDSVRNKNYERSMLDNESWIGTALKEMERGELPQLNGFQNYHRFFTQLFITLRDRTKYKVNWLINNEGQKTYFSQDDFVARNFDQDKKIVEEFLIYLDEIKETEALIAESQRKISEENTLRFLIKEIVREELAKSSEASKTMTLPLNVGNKNEKKDNKVA